MSDGQRSTGQLIIIIIIIIVFRPPVPTTILVLSYVFLYHTMLLFLAL